MIQDVVVRIVSRRTRDGHPFSEVLYTFTEDGKERHALTRLFYSLSDTPHARAAEAQAFLQRQARPWA